MDTWPPSIGTKEHIQWWRTWATVFSVNKVPNCTNSTQPSPRRKNRESRVNSCFVAFPHSFTTKIGGKKWKKIPQEPRDFWKKRHHLPARCFEILKEDPRSKRKKKESPSPFPRSISLILKSFQLFKFLSEIASSLGNVLSRISRKIHSFPMSRIHPFSPISFWGKRKRKIEWLHGFPPGN